MLIVSLFEWYQLLKKYFGIVFLFIYLLSGCSTTPKDYHKLPEPVFEKKQVILPEQKKGKISVLVSTDVLALLNSFPIETIIPSTGKKDQWNEDNIQYSWQRGKINSYLSYDKIVFESVIEYKAKALISHLWKDVLSCGYKEPMRKMVLRIYFKMDISEAYKLQLNPEFSIDSLSDCKISPLKINIQSLLNLQIENLLEKELYTLEEKINQSLNLEEKFKNLYGTLQKPLKVNSNNAWLLLNPESFYYDIGIQDNRMQMSAAINVKPNLIFSKDSPAYMIKDFPGMQRSKADKNFSLQLKIFMDYKEMSELLTKNFAKKEYRFKKNQIKIEQIRAFSSGSMMVLHVTSSGDYNGDIYLYGKPYYNKEDRHIYIDNLNFSIETQNYLLKTYDWLFHSNLLSDIQKNAKWNSESLLKKYKHEIEKSLNFTEKNSEYLFTYSFNGKLDKLEVENLQTQFAGLDVYINMDGELSIEVTNNL